MSILKSISRFWKYVLECTIHVLQFLHTFWIVLKEFNKFEFCITEGYHIIQFEKQI